MTCKHESSAVLYSAGSVYICQCESECGCIFYEDAHGSHVVASPDSAVKEQRDQLAAQVAALAVEAAASLDNRIFDLMGEYKILHLSFDYGNRMVAAFDFNGELIDEGEYLDNILYLIKDTAASEDGEL